MNIINYYRDKIKKIIRKEFSLEESDLKNISFEFPRDSSLGDLSTNASMILSGKLKKSPQEIASKIINLIENNPDFENVEIAGKGFINIKLKKMFGGIYFQKFLMKKIIMVIQIMAKMKK